MHDKNQLIEYVILHTLQNCQASNFPISEMKLQKSNRKEEREKVLLYNKVIIFNIFEGCGFCNVIFWYFFARFLYKFVFAIVVWLVFYLRTTINNFIHAKLIRWWGMWQKNHLNRSKLRAHTQTTTLISQCVKLVAYR